MSTDMSCKSPSQIIQLYTGGLFQHERPINDDLERTREYSCSVNFCSNFNRSCICTSISSEDGGTSRPVLRNIVLPDCWSPGSVPSARSTCVPPAADKGHREIEARYQSRIQSICFRQKYEETCDNPRISLSINRPLAGGYMYTTVPGPRFET
jgi:hypothetical protein